MRNYKTIKELVINTCRNEEVFPSYEKLTSLVRLHFPHSRWQKTHYAWYKSQIKTGKITLKLAENQADSVRDQTKTLLKESTGPPDLPFRVLQNRYRVLRRLGGGGMGEVYEAIDERLRARVAIKRRTLQDVRLKAAFEHEACLLANLNHPALPVVRDYFFERNDQFLVMSYIDGPDFSEQLATNRTTFATDQVLKWADQILDALEYLHSHSPAIVHRDIKPANLKVGKVGNLGQIILLDFGLAKGALGQMSTLVHSNSVHGFTRDYAPLEQVLGLPTDPRSDLYALAATLYHLLTGVAPVDAAERHSALDRGTKDPLQLASTINSAIAVELAEVLSKALALRADDRFQTATDLREALKEIPEERPKVGIQTGVAIGREAQNISDSQGTLKQLQKDYWTALNQHLRGSHSVVRLQQARPYFSIVGPLGQDRVQLFASVHICKATLCVGVRIANRMGLYRMLAAQRDTIEREVVEAIRDDYSTFEWREGKKFQTVSEIWLCRYGADIRDGELLEECLTWHLKALEAVYKAFYQRVRNHARLASLPTAPPSKQQRLAERFWKGFQTRIKDKKELALNNPLFSSAPTGKSSMSKTIQGFRLAAQIHPGKYSVDVNITGGRAHRHHFGKLHKRRNEIEAELQRKLEWKLNSDGESWVLVRREFQLSQLGEWEATYDWLIENLTLFMDKLFPRINSIKKRLEEPTKT